MGYPRLPGYSSEFTGIEFGEAQLVQIKIISGGLWASKGASYIMDLQNLGRSAEKILEVNGDKFNVLASKFLSTWVGPGARRRVPELKTTGEGYVHHPLSAKESIKAAVPYLSRKWYSRAALFWRNIKQVSDNALQLMVRSNWDDFLHLIKDLQLPSMDHLLSNIGNVFTLLRNGHILWFFLL
ncbi:membralin-like protein At1g60995 [Triticum aestivum]|uniref:membralin-like protein At1g60995 n=1 Tax=Triticum aestivum TaxID=4565 RepID=UPI001D02C216|nr:membralin-like protein At1g60995 [Triticum aestivum]